MQGNDRTANQRTQFQLRHIFLLAAAFAVFLVETAFGIGGLGMAVAVTVVNGLLWGFALAVLVRLVNRARNHEIPRGRLRGLIMVRRLSLHAVEDIWTMTSDMNHQPRSQPSFSTTVDCGLSSDDWSAACSRARGPRSRSKSSPP